MDFTLSRNKDPLPHKKCLKDRYATTKQIKSKLESSNIQASEKIVRLKLLGMNFKAHRPAQKPKLTTAMTTRRLQWAKDLQDQDMDFWKSVNIRSNNVHFFIFRIIQIC